MTLAEHRYVCRVAIVWSSSDPDKKVTWLAEGEADIVNTEVHRSFIRWITEPIYFHETSFRGITTTQGDL